MINGIEFNMGAAGAAFKPHQKEKPDCERRLIHAAHPQSDAAFGISAPS